MKLESMDLPEYPCLRFDVSILNPKPNERAEFLVSNLSYGSLLIDSESEGLLRVLMPLMTGKLSTKEILIKCAEIGYHREDVSKLVMELSRRGLIFDAAVTSGLHDDLSIQARWFGSYTSKPANMQDKLRSSTVVIAGYCSIGFAVAEGLARSGIGKLRFVGMPYQGDAFTGSSTSSSLRLDEVVNHLETDIEKAECPDWNDAVVSEVFDEASFVVIAVEASDDPFSSLAKVNKLLIDLSLPSLMIYASNTKLALGPLVVPRETCCYEPIYNSRNPFSETGNASDLFFTDKSPAGPLSFFLSGSFMATAVVVDYLAISRSSILSNCIWLMDWMNTEARTIRLLKNPRCPACSRLNDIPENRPVEE